MAYALRPAHAEDRPEADHPADLRRVVFVGTVADVPACGASSRSARWPRIDPGARLPHLRSSYDRWPSLRSHATSQGLSRRAARRSPCCSGVSLGLEPRRDRLARRALGLGQDDAPLDPRLHPHADVGPGGHRRRGGRPDAGPRGCRDPQAVDRLRLPAVQPLPVAHRARERRVRAERARASAAARRATRPHACSRPSASTTAATSCPATSPAARSSASRSPARSPAAPPILLADEPTANLDSHGRGCRSSRCSAPSRSRRTGHSSIVTHDPKVRAIADRVLRIRDGASSTATRAVATSPQLGREHSMKAQSRTSGSPLRCPSRSASCRHPGLVVVAVRSGRGRRRRRRRTRRPPVPVRDQRVVAEGRVVAYPGAEVVVATRCCPAWWSG